MITIEERRKRDNERHKKRYCSNPEKFKKYINNWRKTILELYRIGSVLA